MKIYVEVRGGVVDAVYTDINAQAEVVMVDYDNIEAGDTEPEQPTENNRFYIY